MEELRNDKIWKVALKKEKLERGLLAEAAEDIKKRLKKGKKK